MRDIIVKPRAALKPLDSGLRPEVLEWAAELRVIWGATGLSLGQFTILRPVDKGTISRYLNGERVPRDHWFLDRLLAFLADKGEPVTPAVCEHLTRLHLRALEAAHPHEYRVRLVRDELEVALTGKLEAERYARSLEEQLAERNREIQGLAEDKSRLRAAWGAGHERLTREITGLTSQLHLAEERAAEAELRCTLLEGLLDQLDSLTPASKDGATSARTTTAPAGPETAYDLSLQDFCARLKSQSRQSRYPKRHLAEANRISPSQLSNILNGKIRRPPSWELVDLIVIASEPPKTRSEALSQWRARHQALYQDWESHKRTAQQARPPRRSARDRLPIATHVAM